MATLLPFSLRVFRLDPCLFSKCKSSKNRHGLEKHTDRNVPLRLSLRFGQASWNSLVDFISFFFFFHGSKEWCLVSYFFDFKKKKEREREISIMLYLRLFLLLLILVRISSRMHTAYHPLNSYRTAKFRQTRL